MTIEVDGAISPKVNSALELLSNIISSTVLAPQ